VPALRALREGAGGVMLVTFVAWLSGLLIGLGVGLRAQARTDRVAAAQIAREHQLYLDAERDYDRAFALLTDYSAENARLLQENERLRALAKRATDLGLEPSHRLRTRSGGALS